MTQTRNHFMVKVRAQDLADAALLVSWSHSPEFAKSRYDEAEQNLLGAIFGDIETLAKRIEEAMDNVNDMDVTFADFALAIACDLTGADLTEAYAARKAAKVAAE